MSDAQKASTLINSLLLLTGGALGAWLLNKSRQDNLSSPQTRPGDLTEQERADFAHTYASTEQALQVMEDYGYDPAISFASFRNAVQQVEQNALQDYRQLQKVIRRDAKE